MTKSAKIILIIVIIAILAVLGILFWPEKPVDNGDVPPDDIVIDTSNWVSYNNEEYGFEIKIPEKWTWLELPEYQRIHFYSDGVTRSEFIMNDAGEVTIFYNLSDIKDDWYKESKQKENIVLDNENATKYIDIPAGHDRKLPSILATVTVVNYNNKFFMINFETDRYSISESRLIPTIDKKIFNDILQSFKFVK